MLPRVTCCDTTFFVYFREPGVKAPTKTIDRTFLVSLKVHKNEIFFGFDFDIGTFSQIVRHKY